MGHTVDILLLTVPRQLPFGFGAPPDLRSCEFWAWFWAGVSGDNTHWVSFQAPGTEATGFKAIAMKIILKDVTGDRRWMVTLLYSIAGDIQLWTPLLDRT